MACKTIKLGAVVPKDFPLVVVADRQIEESFDCMRKFGISMRVVGGEYQPIGADVIDYVLDAILVGLHRYEALFLEVLARFHGQVLRPDIAFALPTFVQAPQQPRQPRAIRFQKRGPQLGMARQDSAGAQAD